jgi:hypothetical protein
VIRNFTAIYLDLVPFRSFTVTLGYSAIYQDWQKKQHRDADGTFSNRRAVSIHAEAVLGDNLLIVTPISNIEIGTNANY